MTIAVVSNEASQLTSALSAIEDPTQLDRMATIRACPDLTSWLEVDTLWQSSGANAGWRDRISGLLIKPHDGVTYPAVSSIAAFNNKPSLLFAASPSVLDDGGANIFPGGTNDFTMVVVGQGVTGASGVILGDGQSSSTGTNITMQSSADPGALRFGVGTSFASVSGVPMTTAFGAIFSYKYGAGSTSEFSARVNNGSLLLSNRINQAGVPPGQKLMIGGYSDGAFKSPGHRVALVMIFKGALLHGTYATQQYSNWSNKYLYQIVEDYLHTKYGV